MSDVKERDFIAEIKFCIDRSDLIKAKALVQFFAEINPKAQNRVLYELSKSPDEIAFPVLDYLLGLEHSNEQVFQKIYDLLLEIAYGNPSMLQEYIRKKDSPHQRCYIKIAGDLKLREVIPVLMEKVKPENEHQIIAETIRTLGAIGSPDCINALLGFLYSEDTDFRAAGIAALAEIGSTSAVEGLTKAVTGDERDQAIVDGLAAIQTQLSMDKLSFFLSSTSADLRSMAIDALIRIGPKAVPNLMEQLQSKNTDLQVHALTILGKIGDKSAVPAIQQLLYEKPDNPNVRFGAYEALGRLPSAKTAISLAGGLTDPDEQVCLAAAKAIDKNLTNILLAGLKNLINSGEEDARKIVAAFIDAGADNVFETLIEWGPFPEIAANYLAEEAHPDVKNHYMALLRKNGKEQLLQRINRSVPVQVEGLKPVIYAIDDSTMMLKLYQKKLYSMGYEPVVFQYPNEAISAAKKNKPALIITDLNMPLINGLQLTRELRSCFSAKTLPIIMITTQSDFLGRSQEKTSAPISESEIMKAGVNNILHKPFQDSDLAALIQALLNTSRSS